MRRLFTRFVVRGFGMLKSVGAIVPNSYPLMYALPGASATFAYAEFAELSATDISNSLTM